MEESSEIPFINSETSQEIDKELMSTFSYSIDQLMEHAGLCVATVIYEEIIKKLNKNEIKILTICGPGNNGGDGLVASRYLKEFSSAKSNNNLNIEIFYPKKNTKNELYSRLVKQCESYDIKINNTILNDIDEYTKYFQNFDIIIDAIFGFSFKGDIREPFKNIILSMKKYEDKIVSIDLPSGFNIEEGNTLNTFVPHCLISLTLPKLCSKNFKGEHFLGGRFIPPKLFEKFNLKIKQDLYNESKLYIKIN